jgi:hypothetical protein
MNTGVQRFGHAAGGAHRDHHAVGPEPGNVFGQGKFLPAIAMAHEIPYVATATVADLRDLEYKVTKAMTIRGARYIHILVPCPLGWGTASHDTIAGAAGQGNRHLPGVRGEHGESSRSTKIRRPLPVEDYLKPQKRFAHLFGKNPAVEPSPECRRWPTRTSASYDCSARRRTDDKPFAITLDPGSSLANHTGSWRTERPVYVDRCRRATTSAPPARHPGLAVPRRRATTKRLAAPDQGQPLPGDHGPRLLPHLRGACNRGQLDSPVGINSVERFLGDEAIKRAGSSSRSRRSESGKHVLIVGAGPSGMSAAYHLRRLGHR